MQHKTDPDCLPAWLPPAYTFACVCVCMYVCMHATSNRPDCLPIAHIMTYIHTDTHIYTLTILYVCMYINIYIHTCIYTYVATLTRFRGSSSLLSTTDRSNDHTCICEWMYICMYVCMAPCSQPQIAPAEQLASTHIVHIHTHTHTHTYVAALTRFLGSSSLLSSTDRSNDGTCICEWMYICMYICI